MTCLPFFLFFVLVFFFFCSFFLCFLCFPFLYVFRFFFCFSFLFVSFVYVFFSCGLRASGINLHLVFNWEHVSWGPKSAFFICSFYFYVFLFLLLFYETCKDMKNSGKCAVFFLELIYVLQGFAWCDVLWKNLRLYALWWHFGSQSLVWSVVARFHFNFSAHPCRLQPMVLLARTAKRHREVNPMMAGINPFLASTFGPAFALLVPTRAESCWLCFDGSMRCVATRDQTRHWFLMCLFCHLLSDVWHRRASVVKTKSVLIGFNLNRLNRIK